MIKENNIINCPNCDKKINVNDILYHQVDEQLKKQYSDEFTQEKEKYKTEFSKLKKEKDKLEQEKSQQKEQIKNQVKNELKQKEILLKKKYKAEAIEEQSGAINTLHEELEEKSKKIKEFNKMMIVLEKLKREKNEFESSIKVELEKELNEKLLTAKEKIQEEENQKNELKFKTLEKQLTDQKKLTEEMKRKQEQGSMQTQGEVQELGIEEWLTAKFPLDIIQEIKKGEPGADCLQIIHTYTRQNCGLIYYESKRTKSFNLNWIEKFKADIQEKNANIGVLVTEVMPQDMDRFGLKEGIWICSFEEFKGLCTVLRESIIQVSNIIATQDNKGNKMEMLYSYLISNEFRLQIEAIVEGFTQMKSDLISEQRSMRTIWKKREKQIDKVLLNTTDMYGSIKGIAGNAIQSVPILELPTDNKDDLNI